MKAQNSREEKTWASRKTRFVERQGTERLSVLTHAKVSCCRESFHAATVPMAGGERSWISTAVNLSITIIGPPHLGQSQRPLESLLPDMAFSVLGAVLSRADESKVAGAWRACGWRGSRSSGCAQNLSEARARGSDAGTHPAIESATSVGCCERNHANEK